MLFNRRRQSRQRHNETVGEKDKESGIEKLKESSKAKRRSFQPVVPLQQRFSTRLKREKRLKLLVFLVLLSPFVLKWVLRPLEVKYFGEHGSMEGGELGAKMDRRSRRLHRQRIEKRRRQRLGELGIILPPLDESRNENYLTLTSEILSRRAERKRRLSLVERDVQQRLNQCKSSSTPGKQDNNATVIIPHHILQSNYGSWFRPRQDTQMPGIPFEEYDMRILVQGAFPSLLRLYEKSTIEGRLLLWSLCALYQFGGYVFGEKDASRIEGLLDGIDGSDSACDHVATFTITQETLGGPLQFLRMTASPRHPLLKCAIDRLGVTPNMTITAEVVLENLYPRRLWNSSKIALDLAESNDKELTTDVREVMSSECSTLQPSSLCDIIDFCASETIGKKSRIYAKLVRPDSFDARKTTNEQHEEDVSSSRLHVSIAEPPDTPAPVKTQKISVRDLTKTLGCDAGWRCNRCLHDPLSGSYESCKTVCSDCFIDLICNKQHSHSPPRNIVTFNLVVRQSRNLLPGEYQIPRVVHQTWYEDLTVDRFPQLTRVQSSWRNVGFEYRFYTDKDARDYIAKNFPSLFLYAYDSLLPGAFKADLFRLLVLLKDGGIYVDVDVLAGANLNAFITPSMSFFVPLDLVGADYDEEFCLWNGLIGSVPGHPIIVHAVEWLVTMILNRADVYDFERELCGYTGEKLEVWKARQAKILLLSGPCALGVAANRAMEKPDPLSRIESGWLTSEQTHASGIGEALVLRGDKFDMNAFRFTDVDRNLIVASTDMIDLTSNPLETKKETALRKPAHYSETEVIDDLFGAKGVYVDNMVTNEEIRLAVTHS